MLVNSINDANGDCSKVKYFDNVVKNDSTKIMFLIWGIVAALVVIWHVVWVIKDYSGLIANKMMLAFFVVNGLYVVLSGVWFFGLYGGSELLGPC